MAGVQDIGPPAKKQRIGYSCDVCPEKTYKQYKTLLKHRREDWPHSPYRYRCDDCWHNTNSPTYGRYDHLLRHWNKGRCGGKEYSLVFDPRFNTVQDTAHVDQSSYGLDLSMWDAEHSTLDIPADIEVAFTADFANGSMSEESSIIAEEFNSFYVFSASAEQSDLFSDSGLAENSLSVWSKSELDHLFEATNSPVHLATAPAGMEQDEDARSPGHHALHRARTPSITALSLYRAEATRPSRLKDKISDVSSRLIFKIEASTRWKSITRAPLCPLCRQSFGSHKAAIEEHVRDHREESTAGMHLCHECDIGFKYEADLRMHLRAAEGGSCGFKFEHTESCSGHHRNWTPPGRPRAFTDGDKMLIALWHWEDKQFSNFRWVYEKVVGKHSEKSDSDGWSIAGMPSKPWVGVTAFRSKRTDAWFRVR